MTAGPIDRETQMTNELNFTDKNVFIMGGTSGINLGIAECFAARGATVIVAGRSQDKIDAAVERLQGIGPKATGFSADVRNPESVEAGLGSIVEELGPIDVMVVGQAGNFPAAAMKMSTNAFKSVVDIDLLGTFNVVRVAHQHLNKSGASIINISAPQASIAMDHQAHVCAAKAGVDMLTRVLAVELGPENIRVNAIVPGPIDKTEGMARLAPTPEMREAVSDSVPLRRYGSTHDIGNCALFLASPLAAYVNGAIIPVDGGWVAAGTGPFQTILSGAA